MSTLTKKRLRAVGAVIVALGLAALGLNAGANASARAELDHSCGCARQSVEQTLTASDRLMLEMFGDDAGEMRSFMRSEVTSLCAELHDEMGPWTWNLGRRFSPSPAPERAARATRAIDRARPRCPAVYRELLGGSGADAGQMERLCDELFDGMARNDSAEAESILVWEWPAAIDRSMCLDAVRTRERSSEAP